MALSLQVDQELQAAAQPVKDQQGHSSPLSISTSAVGVGTVAPKGTLDVAGNVVLNGNTGTQLAAVGDAVTLKGSPIILDADTTHVPGSIQIGSSVNAAFNLQPADASPNAGYIRFGDQTGWKLHFGRTRESSLANGTPPNTGIAGVMVTIQDNGNVGIGTTTPTEKLVVNGNILATGDVILTGADCAEDFDVTDAASLEPGTVMVIGHEGRLRRSETAYDTRVAGVLSGAGEYRPGIVLDKQQSQDDRLPVALTGKVFCKVDARYAPVDVGDLLTTSPTTGHAMKAGDPLKAFGAVIGKALRPLPDGQGLIPILIALN